MNKKTHTHIFRLASCIVILLAFTLYGCYTSKPLPRQVKIRFNQDFKVVLHKTALGEFLPYYSEDEYRKAFIESFIASLKGDNVIIDDLNPEFDVYIDYLDLEEKVRYDTVKNPNSVDNGKVFDVKQANLKAQGTFKRNVGGNPVTWSADKSKSERITMGRNSEQVASAQPNDDKKYRKVAFDHNEFQVLAGNCGRRSATVIVNRIKRDIKK